jgi:hypothetical protein
MVSRRRYYIAAKALEKLADCPCAGRGQIDTPAIREQWWRRHRDDDLIRDPTSPSGAGEAAGQLALDPQEHA